MRRICLAIAGLLYANAAVADALGDAIAAQVCNTTDFYYFSPVNLALYGSADVTGVHRPDANTAFWFVHRIASGQQGAFCIMKVESANACRRAVVTFASAGGNSALAKSGPYTNEPDCTAIP